MNFSEETDLVLIRDPSELTPQELSQADFNKRIIVDISKDPNTLADCLLVGIAMTGLSIGSIKYLDAIAIQKKLGDVANILEKRLNIGPTVWRQLAKSASFIARSIFSGIAAISGQVATVTHFIPKVFEMANIATPEVVTDIIAVSTGATAGALVGRSAADYVMTLPRAGEKQALQAIQKPTMNISDKLALATNKAKTALQPIIDNASQLVKLKHFSRVTKRYFDGAPSIVVQQDDTPLVRTLVLAGLAAASIAFAKSGCNTLADAQKRLDIITKRLIRDNKLWFRLKSSLTYSLRGLFVGDELVLRARNKNLIDVARGSLPAEAAESVGQKVLTVIA